MKKLLLSIVLAVAIMNVLAAPRYWVGRGGDSKWVTVSNWASTSGGSDLVTAPTTGDDVTFDAAVNASPTVTLNTGVTVNSITFTNSNVVFTLINAGTSFLQTTDATGVRTSTTGVVLSSANANIQVGQAVTLQSGTGSLSANTTVSAISGTSLTLSKVAATSSTAACTLSFAPVGTITTTTMTVDGSQITFVDHVTINSSLTFQGTNPRISMNAYANGKIFTLGNGFAFTLTGHNSSNYFDGNGNAYFSFNTSSALSVYFNPTTPTLGNFAVTKGAITLMNNLNSGRLDLKNTNSEQIILGTNVNFTCTASGSCSLAASGTANAGTIDASASGCKFAITGANNTICGTSSTSYSLFKANTTVNNFELNNSGATYYVGLANGATAVTFTNLTLSNGTINNSTNNVTIANGGRITRSNQGALLTSPPIYGTSSTDRVNVTIGATCNAANELLGTTSGKVGTLTINSGSTYTLSSTFVTGYTSLAGGSSYSGTTTATWTSPTTGGVNATGTCTLTTGAVTSIVITNPGTGFNSAPVTSSITGTAGSGAAATAIISTNSSLYADALNIAGNLNFANTASQPVTLNVGGDVTVTSSGSISASNLSNAVNHVLNVKGNISNSGTINLYNAATTKAIDLTLNGISANQNLGAATLNSLTVNNIAASNSGATLTGAVSVANVLTLTNGKVALGANGLTIVASGSISGASATNYIVTDGTGKLTQTVTSSVAKTFPIGASTSSYDPAIINPTSTLAYSAKVASTLSGTPANSSSTNPREWDITPSSGTPTATFTFTPSVASNISNPSIGFYNGTVWSEAIATLSGTSFTGTYTLGTTNRFATGSRQAFIATSKYWVGGASGNWSDVSSWSTSTGGTPGAAVPVAGDDVYFDANSGAADVIAYCTGTSPVLNSLNATSCNVTFAIVLATTQAITANLSTTSPSYTLSGSNASVSVGQYVYVYSGDGKIAFGNYVNTISGTDLTLKSNPTGNSTSAPTLAFATTTATSITTKTVTLNNSNVISYFGITVNGGVGDNSTTYDFSLLGTSTFTQAPFANSQSITLGNGGTFYLNGNTASNYFDGSNNAKITFNTSSTLNMYFNQSSISGNNGVGGPNQTTWANGWGAITNTKGTINIMNNMATLALTQSELNNQTLVLGAGAAFTLSGNSTCGYSSAAGAGSIDASNPSCKFIITSGHANNLSSIGTILKPGTAIAPINWFEFNRANIYTPFAPMFVKNLVLTAGTINNSTNNITVVNGGTITRSNQNGLLTAPPIYGTSSTDRVNVTIGTNCNAANELLGTTSGKVGTLMVNSGSTYTLSSTFVTGYTSLTGGNSYTGTTTATWTSPTTGGVNATGACTLTGGIVTSILITNPGTGFNSAPVTTSITGTAGSSASATAVISTNSSLYADALNVAGTLYFANTASQPVTLNVGGDVAVNTGGSIVTNNLSNAVNHVLNVGGNISNSGTINLYNTATSAVDLTLNGTSSIQNMSSATLNNLTINPGSRLTTSGTITAKILNINSATDGSVGTLLDNGTLTATTTNVNQFLKGATGGTSTRGYWYLSSPVSAATSSVFDVASGINKMTSYDETIPGYVTQFGSNDTALTPGTGYVTYIGGGDATYNFTGGNLNNGTIPTITLTRTGTTAGKRGFNLIGNPYPSYLDWNAVYATSTNMRQSIWYRTFTGTTMQFDTFDGTNGTGNGVNGTVTQYIPPMQAFWARVDQDGSNGTISLTNLMRSHQDQTLVTNRLRVPALTNPALLRLKVSNGVNSDEALVVANPNATNGYDSYDSQKMSNDNAAIPEIFTIAGTEEIVINNLNSITANIELPLGFRTGASNAFSIRASQVSNFDAGMKVILKDNVLNTEQDITDGTPYNFSSDVVNSSSRFTIVFRTASVTTGVNPTESNPESLFVYKNAANQIVVNTAKSFVEQGTVTVCNAEGQKLVSTSTTGAVTVISKPFTPGVYFVTIHVAGKNATKKVILN